MTIPPYYGTTRRTWKQRLEDDPKLGPKIVELYTKYSITVRDISRRFSTNDAEIKKVLVAAGVTLRHGKTF